MVRLGCNALLAIVCFCAAARSAAAFELPAAASTLESPRAAFEEAGTSQVAGNLHARNSLLGIRQERRGNSLRLSWSYPDRSWNGVSPMLHLTGFSGFPSRHALGEATPFIVVKKSPTLGIILIAAGVVLVVTSSESQSTSLVPGIAQAGIFAGGVLVILGFDKPDTGLEDSQPPVHLQLGLGRGSISWRLAEW